MQYLTYMTRKVLLLLLLLPSMLTPAMGWIYPEHRRIALLAIQRMSADNRRQLDVLWAEARVRYANRLTEGIIEPDQGRKPKQLDFAAWAGISGDHSCSPQNLLDIVLNSDWILNVADVAARLEKDIAKAKNRSARVNALRNSDIRLQRADAEYASRAGSNNVHFLLSRSEVDVEVAGYIQSCMLAGAELNALGVYNWFHSGAVRKMEAIAANTVSAEDRADVILSALADEAFALHFLEDVFAAGHTAGTWGSAAVRKGTHDYYNESGLEVSTWDGKRIIVKGDAWMTQRDANLASEAVRVSIEQLMDVASGRGSLEGFRPYPAPLNKPDTLNVCKNNFMPAGNLDATGVRTTLAMTPVPGLGTGEGELPRFRSELGLFVGFSAGARIETIAGGFGADQKDPGAVGGLEANVRVGLGLDGVLNEAGDGLVFLQAGLRQDASSTNRFINSGAALPPGALLAAIPARTGYNFRVRMPFWLVPGDLVLAAPVLLLVSPGTLTKMAVTAGNGGLIPWQSGIATPIGRFQFIAGREVGVTIYGSNTPREDAVIIKNSAGTTTIMQYSSTKFEFPIIEYRPYRSFSLNQSSSIIAQLTAGFDIPHSATILYPANEPAPELKTVWNVGLRVIFDWRKYM